MAFIKSGHIIAKNTFISLQRYLHILNKIKQETHREKKEKPILKIDQKKKQFPLLPKTLHRFRKLSPESLYYT